MYCLKFGNSICHTHLLYILGLEKCKAREDGACKEEDNDEDSSKDMLIKRKVAMKGQAISVVGGYAENVSTAEAPSPATVKRLPEPIVPTAQTK